MRMRQPARNPTRTRTRVFTTTPGQKRYQPECWNEGTARCCEHSCIVQPHFVTCKVSCVTIAQPGTVGPYNRGLGFHR